MNTSLKTYIEQYIQLETGMQELVLKKCGSLCSKCTCVCCDIVMCVEAVKSPFLKQVHQQEDQFDPEKGFLSATGCSLKHGRPSICYEYYCDNHFFYQPDDLHAEVLKILGALLYHAVQHAQGNISIDDIETEEELERIDFTLLNKQMGESMQALEIIRAFYRDKTISDDGLRILRCITIADELDTPAESSARQ